MASIENTGAALWMQGYRSGIDQTQPMIGDDCLSVRATGQDEFAAATKTGEIVKRHRREN